MPSLGWLAWLCMGALLVGSPSTLAAQAPRFAVEGRAGIGLPVGELAEFVDAGPAAGVKVLFGLSERVSVVADGGVLFLEGNPNVQAWSYLGGLRARLVGGPDSRWSLLADIAGGGTSFLKSSFDVILIAPPPPPPRGARLATSATVRVGLTVARRLSPRFVLFLDGAWHRMFTEGEELTVQAREPSPAFGATSAVPITLGLRFRSR